MAKKRPIANKRTQNKKVRPLSCVICGRVFKSLLSLRKHTRTHPPAQTDDSDSLIPQHVANNLLSAQAHDPVGTVFEFSTVLNDSIEMSENKSDVDVDSIYSDYLIERDIEHLQFPDDDEYDFDDHPGVYDDDDNDDHNGDDEEDNNDDDDNYDDDSNGDENDGLDDDEEQDASTPIDIPQNNVSDEDVPYSKSSFLHQTKMKLTSAFEMQLELISLFNKNKASLKLYDEMISLFNKYISSHDFTKHTKLLPRKALLSKVENIFDTAEMKPTYGTVRLHNKSLATVPVFDMKAMILSLVHDDTIMKDDNFAKGYNIFTGDEQDDAELNNCYGEIHTGKAWKDAKAAYCGVQGKYMPCAVIVFADKSHTDQHGALSVTPITFTATFFNRKARNNPRFWRPMAYIPNLAYGKGQGGKSIDKSQDEHNCIAFAFKSLVDLCNAGGIKTIVMGKEVHMKIWIHFFIGDTEGHNKWLGHYSTSNSGVQRPYRDCHCSFADMSNTNPNCVYSTSKEMRLASKLMLKDKQKGKKKFKSMSRHYLNQNALFQEGLPLSDLVHGANKMQPPEMLHTSDSGLILYMQESLQGLLPGGLIREDLDAQHVRMSAKIRRQSERDFPRGSIRNGLIDSTRCQSSERKGNLFYLLCIANTSSGELILKHELNFSDHHWLQWTRFLKLYLSMEAWFHNEIPRSDVKYAREAISHILSLLQLYFPRQADSNGYNIPKMHGMTKMIHYVELFGSAINFYGGPGEASHKQFVKAPGLKTQRRMGEFATQTAGQYYNVMMVEKAMKLVGSIEMDKVAHEYVEGGDNGDKHDDAYEVMGKYTLDVMDGKIHCCKNDIVNRHGLHPELLDMLKRKYDHVNDDFSLTPVTGFFRASVFDEDGEKITFNAHPWYHGAPWYDWAWVDYIITHPNGDTSRECYPSKVLGFIKENEGTSINAVVHCSEESMKWATVERDFVVSFKLGLDLKESVVSVPLSALIHPIGVIPNYGAADKNSYMIILPQRSWNKYFSTYVQTFA